MPRPRPIDVRIQEAKEKLEMLTDQKKIAALQLRMKARRGNRRRRRL